MYKHASLPRRRWIGLLFCAAAISAVAATPFPASALASDDTAQVSVIPGSLGFGASPALPDISSLVLNGQAQSISSRVANFEVSDASGAGLGWNISVSGDDGPGKSPVLKQYCPAPDCGDHAGPGYVAHGSTLPADSLTLDSSGATFMPVDGSTGPRPAHQCNAGCFVDAPPRSPTKVVVAASGTGMGTFRTSGFSSSSLRLAAPVGTRGLQTGELYRVDLSWTLNSGP
jgi:hypothetical protein